ncbi:MAG: HAD-IA family hydrolase, partial [Coriobacteriales bacterium]|nr:HAD-IA family hydrolase [Coriobacteriales bacterium]
MKAILFDLDGTLLDTRDLILVSMQYAYCTVLGEESLPSDDKLLSMVGIPLKEQMERLSPKKSEELFETYLEYNARVQDSMLTDFAGTKEALDALLEKGFRLAVVTSKRHGSAAYGLKHTGLLDYFELLLGSDDTPEHKPKPGPLLAAAKLMGLAPHECAYLGDSPYDMLAARSAGMQAIGALWGMFSQKDLLDAGAEVLISDVSELVGLNTL